MRQSRLAGMAVALGITLGTVILVSLSLLGIGALYDSNPLVKHTASAFAISYLLYLAYEKWRFLKYSEKSNDPTLNPYYKNHKTKALIMKGLIVDISNPKALAFFITIFTGLSDEKFATPEKFFICVFIIIMTFVYYGGMASLASLSAKKHHPRRDRLLAQVSMVLFVCFAVMIFFNNYA
jgi:threonine/homoserine/homoserine lactone efflux protein